MKARNIMPRTSEEIKNELKELIRSANPSDTRRCYRILLATNKHFNSDDSGIENAIDNIQLLKAVTFTGKCFVLIEDIFDKSEQFDENDKTLVKAAFEQIEFIVVNTLLQEILKCLGVL